VRGVLVLAKVEDWKGETTFCGHYRYTSTTVT